MHIEDQERYLRLVAERDGTVDLNENLPAQAADRHVRHRAVGEEEWRRQVRQIALTYGWDLMYHTADSRRSDAGWPDEVLGHVKQRRTLFVEFKSQQGRLRPAQRLWLTHLADSGLEVAVWRPSDLQTVLHVLGPTRQRAVLPPDFRRNP
ncbi:VRR-NUC domain-containing protein [Streptomyces luteireticuli]|uniref:VRR-NUC domain-containing protein n=1 Tax=Streptomyces luteireticuli TaxID=173858 RepID=UPI003557F37A